jgi:hypothetical protein
MVSFDKSVPHFIAARSVQPHSVLTDPALLRAIFEHLIDAKDERDVVVHARSQLLRLATCCKAFSEPALDLLWRKMDDLLPLLKILPSFERVGDAYVRVLPPREVFDKRSISVFSDDSWGSQ